MQLLTADEGVKVLYKQWYPLREGNELVTKVELNKARIDSLVKSKVVLLVTDEGHEVINVDGDTEVVNTDNIDKVTSISKESHYIVDTKEGY